MSRMIGRGRYATETYPQGPGGGGGAGGASVPLSRQRFIDGDTVQVGLNGAAAEPFKTIAQFIASRSNAVSAADSAANFVGWLTPSIAGYVEDIAFPGRCSTELRADSMSLPGTGGVNVTGNATWANTSGTAADPAANLALHNVNITGSLTVTDNVSSPPTLLSITGDEEPAGGSSAIGSIVAGSTQTLSSVALQNAQCVGALTLGAGAANAVAIITGGSIVGGDITAKSVFCVNAALGSSNITVNSGGSAIFQATTFSHACVLTAGVSSFDGPSWQSFIAIGGTRAVGTTVLVQGGYNAAPVEGAALTGAATNVSLNGTGATAGFTGEHSGNHYSSASNTPTSVTLLTGGGEKPGDTILISRTTLGTGVLAVINGGGGAGTLGTIPVNARGFVLAQFNGTNWVFVEGGSMLA